MGTYRVQLARAGSHTHTHCVRFAKMNVRNDYIVCARLCGSVQRDTRTIQSGVNTSFSIRYSVVCENPTKTNEQWGNGTQFIPILQFSFLHFSSYSFHIWVNDVCVARVRTTRTHVHFNLSILRNFPVFYLQNQSKQKYASAISVSQSERHSSTLLEHWNCVHWFGDGRKRKREKQILNNNNNGMAINWSIKRTNGAAAAQRHATISRRCRPVWY